MTRAPREETILSRISMLVRRRTGETFFIGRTHRPRLDVARSEIAGILDEPAGERRLRAALAHELPLGRVDQMSREELVDALAKGVAAGRFVMIGFAPRPVWAPTIGAQEEAPKERDAPPPEEEESSWIEIHVVDWSTGSPVSGVVLFITPPSGSEAEHKTDDKGKVRVDGIPKGTCVVRAKMTDATHADTLIFMGAGSGEPPAPPDDQGQAEDQGQSQSAPLSIAVVEKHKVSRSETLDSLAKSIGTTWKKLAKFNWNTDEPHKINGFLRTVVGCTKKTADGLNYAFDDSDDPGIVLLPQAWKADAMETGSVYTIEVASAATRKAWIFSM